MDRYQFHHPLETGPDVRVYEILDRWEGNQKRIFTILNQPLGCQESWLREVENAFARREVLEHQTLPGVVDFCHRGKKLGLVSDKIDFSPIRLRTLRSRISAARQLCDVVEYVHSRGLHFGVLKPSQLFFFDEADTLKVNFLLASRLVHRPNGMAWLRYAAPEYLEGTRESPQADLYSVGMLLYYLLTGQEPFGERNPINLRRKKLFATLTRPRTLNPDIPADLEDLVLDLTQRCPSDRPHNLESVSSLLRNNQPRQTRCFPLSRRSSIIGRTEEQEVLWSHIKAFAERPETHVIVLNGVSGIGKSRLVSFAGTLSRLLNLRVCHLKHHFGDEPLMAFRRLVQFLRTVLEVDCVAPEELWTSLKDLLSAFSRGQGVVLLSDDLQWIDEQESQFYYRLASYFDQPILLIGNARCDTDSPHWRQLHQQLDLSGLVTSITVRSLSRVSTYHLIAELLSPEINNDEIAERLWKLSKGNPFFVYELVRSLLERSDLGSSEGRWHWILDWDGVDECPREIRRQVLERLSQLDGLSRELIQHAAIWDRPISISHLSSLLCADADAITDAVMSLQKRDLATASGRLQECQVAVSHEWIARIARESLSPHETVEIHRRAAGLLLSCKDGNHLSFRSQAIVEHSWKCGDFLTLREHFWPAIGELEAARMYRNASDVLVRACSEGLLDSSQWEVVHKTLEMLYLAGKLHQCTEFAETYLSEVPGIQSDRIAWVLHILSLVSLIRGLPRDATERCLRALDIIPGDLGYGLRNQIEAVLLASLSQDGRENKARELLLRISQREETRFSDKLHHAISVHFVHTEGKFAQAITPAVEALRVSLEQGNYVQFLGRLTHLASLYSRIGNLSRCNKVIKFFFSFRPEFMNLQLDRFARLNWCDAKRKVGSHKEALALTQYSLSPSANGENDYTRWVALLEQAKNYNYMLLPEAALEKLDRAALLAGSECLGLIDSEILRFWSEFLLGRLIGFPTRSKKLSWNANNLGRYYLFKSTVLSRSGRLCEAMSALVAAENSFAESLPYNTVRLLLLKAEILHARGEFEEAFSSAREGLGVARERFFFPAMAKGYVLCAKCLAALGRVREGRAYCLRALQVARRVERPGLRAEIFRSLGGIEARLGDLAAARQAFGRAVRILKERALQLSPENRDAFVRHHIEPILKERDQFLGKGETKGTPSIREVYQILTSFRSATDLKSLAGRILDATETSIPGAAANFLVSYPDGQVEILASRGQCKRSGRHLLVPVQPRPKERLEIDLSDGAYRTLQVPFRLGGGLSGALYIESNDGEISEGHLDFLNCLGPAVELAAMHSPPRPDSSDLEPAGLGLRGGKRIIGASPAMRNLFHEVQRIAPSRANVLLSGESGTGKELFAAAIHQFSRRPEGPFTPVNCPAIPADLIENELFGHVKGAFTGASGDVRGLFEATSGGTLFLDEISAMPMELQGRLLRVIQERKIRRIGDSRERPVDVRIVAATNQPLKDLVEEDRFRLDLYHRLNVCQLTIPPLREHLADLPLLIEFFLNEIAHEEGLVKTFHTDALARLSTYDFPGNVRELRNIVESAYLLCDGPVILPHHVESRLNQERTRGFQTDTPVVRRLAESLASGKADFWSQVKDPYLSRDLSRREVREIVAIGLAAVGGSYRKLLEYFGLPPEDYRRFMAFLTHHNCNVDFRPFRKSPPAY